MLAHECENLNTKISSEGQAVIYVKIYTIKNFPLYGSLICPAGNNLRKIHLVTLRVFLGLLHTLAGFQRGQRWPYMDVLMST